MLLSHVCVVVTTDIEFSLRLGFKSSCACKVYEWMHAASTISLLFILLLYFVVRLFSEINVV